MSIPVETLAEATITRERGTQAFEKLSREIEDHRHEANVFLVDISRADLVSQSFLDELVIQIDKYHAPDVKIGFRITTDRDLQRLQRVCSLRRVRCTYQYGDSHALRRTSIRRDRRPRTAPYRGDFFET